jgi:hypothetical protein
VADPHPASQRPLAPDASRNADAEGDRPPAAPGWVKALALAAVLLVALVVAWHLTGGGFPGHG